MKKGKIIILSGPSGAGKTTLYKKLIADKKFKGKLVKSISVTTRPRRVKEKHGCDYLFLSEKKFLYKCRAGHFLEHQKVFNDFYGTPNKNVKDLIKAGKDVLLCIDVKGARVVAQKYPEAIKIFIKTLTLKVLKDRLIKRGTESKGNISTRLKIARQELKEAIHYDHIIINDDLTRAYQELEAIIAGQL